jgi:hypothetical protein
MSINQPDRSPDAQILPLVLSPIFQINELLHLKVIFLRKQLEILARTSSRPRLRPSDRIFFNVMTDIVSSWKEALLAFTPRDRHPLATAELFRRGQTEDPSGANGPDQLENILEEPPRALPSSLVDNSPRSPHDRTEHCTQIVIRDGIIPRMKYRRETGIVSQ